MSASYRYCSEHGDTLIWERGGPAEPTIFGRWYCPTCQELFLEAMDAPTVCIAHGRFIPCRKSGDHRYTANPYWVKSVRDYQSSTIVGLTWEPTL